MPVDIDSSFIDSSFQILLPKSGIYHLNLFGKREKREIQIRSKYNYDTIRLSTINMAVIVGHIYSGKEPEYICCDKPCNGYTVDFYQNGNKAMEGIFKNGSPIGELNYYNLDGTTREIHLFDIEGNGKLIEIKKF